MSPPCHDGGGSPRPPFAGDALLAMLRAHYESAQQVRRGVCLLGAGHYDQAATAFAVAASRGVLDKSLPSRLAACFLAQGDPAAAAEQFEKLVDTDKGRTAAQIRHALALWSAQRRDEAIASLRKSIASDPECAELHFQLGTLLTSLERYDEAELRFGQALSIDRDHSEALVSLALCCGLRGTPAEAVRHLQRAQTLKPHDARIGLLLAQAAAALKRRGQAVHLRASMPGEEADDVKGIAELSRIIETEPDFVDAFLSIPSDRVDAQVFAVIARALDAALGRRPDDARLHFQRGRVLDRSGRRDEAINANERAIEIDPKFTQALIELGRLYAQTDRTADATTRLREAVAQGAEYPDVYLLLGNLYRDQGLIGPARSAYRRALVLNEHYEAAQAALAALPT